MCCFHSVVKVPVVNRSGWIMSPALHQGHVLQIVLDALQVKTVDTLRT